MEFSASKSIVMNVKSIIPKYISKKYNLDQYFWQHANKNC